MTNDSRIPPADACVLRCMLDKWAGLTPDKVFVACFNPNFKYPAQE